MENIAIRAEGLSKRYAIGPRHARYHTLRDTLVAAFLAGFRHQHDSVVQENAKRGMIWALKDVSFEANHGDVIGIIGRNGAGKTTLLKILSRITDPTAGQVEMFGRVNSLLEVGTGFHPELSGRENIYLNGAIMGMRRHEIARKFDEIVEFSEVHAFLDTPVKHYSSGMYARLAFAVAAHLESEILFVDEVLAVGDMAFQRKCLGKMGDVAKEGRTIFLVSHNMASILALCQRVIWLDSGKIVSQGQTHEVVTSYLKTGSVMMSEVKKRQSREGDGSITILNVTWTNAEDPDLNAIRIGDRLKIFIEYRAAMKVKAPVFSVGVYDHRGVCIYNFNSEIAGWTPDTLPQNGTVTCLTDPICVTSHWGWMNVLVKKGGVIADYIPEACAIHFATTDYYGTGRLPDSNYCLYALKNVWKLEHQRT